jgi:4-amino-4-deoxy-L-arabinose transferase-like glycosyltransferase
VKLLNYLNFKKVGIFIIILVSALIINQGIKLRWLGYERIPETGIFDERNYALQGLSIRNSGIPTAWSDSGAYLHGYNPEDMQSDYVDLSITAKGLKPNIGNYNNFPKPLYIVREFDFGLGKQQIRFVQPFMDHSPVGGLISSLGFKNKISDFLDVTPDKYRIPALYLGILNSILLLILAYLLTNSLIASTISVGIYNTVPVFVFSSRFALLENYLIPFALTQIILFILSKRVKRYSLSLLLISGLISGLGILVKETGIGYSLGLFILLFLWKYNLKRKAVFLLGVFLPCVTYFMWGLLLSPNLFMEIIMFNSSRGFFGSLNLLSVLPSLRFPNFPLDGWWIWSFLSILLISISHKNRYYPLTIPFFGHLIAIMFISNSNYPWYFLGLIPLLVISSAIIIKRIITNPKIHYTIPFALIPLSSSLYWGNTVYNLPPNIMIYRLVVLGFITLSLIRIKYRNNKIIKTIWFIVCLGILYEIFKWNKYSVFYIIENWGKLPIKSLPAL